MSGYDVTLGIMRRILIDAGATPESANAAALVIRAGGTVQLAAALIEYTSEPGLSAEQRELIRLYCPEWRTWERLLRETWERLAANYDASRKARLTL